MGVIIHTREHCCGDWNEKSEADAFIHHAIYSHLLTHTHTLIAHSYSFIHSLNHSFIHTHTHSLIHTPNHCPFICTLHSFIHSYSCLLSFTLFGCTAGHAGSYFQPGIKPELPELCSPGTPSHSLPFYEVSSHVSGTSLGSRR